MEKSMVGGKIWIGTAEICVQIKRKETGIKNYGIVIPMIHR